MQKNLLLATVIAALMLSPSLAAAQKNNNAGYKPKSENSAKKKGNRNANKGQNKKAKKRANNNKGSKKASERKPNVAAYNPPRKKKSKSRRFKRFLKRTLRDLSVYAGPVYQGRRYYGQRNNYDYTPDNYCLPKHKLRRRLVRRGWHDFELVAEHPNRIRLAATYFNGRRFIIVVDRCNGSILKRRPIRSYWRRAY